jgi:hypothetical protein
VNCALAVGADFIQIEKTRHAEFSRPVFVFSFFRARLRAREPGTDPDAGMGNHIMLPAGCQSRRPSRYLDRMCPVSGSSSELALSAGYSCSANTMLESTRQKK